MRNKIFSSNQATIIISKISFFTIMLDKIIQIEEWNGCWRKMDRINNDDTCCGQAYLQKEC